jgi:DNA-binding NtrC family response regulator
MSLIRKNGDLRRFQTRIEGELGQTTPVEVTAVGDDAEQPNYFGFLIRDMSHASKGPSPDVSETGSFFGALDNRTLEAIVRLSTETIERQAILAALGECDDNRTAAARRLGLSRQGLHAKLKKYGLERK